MNSELPEREFVVLLVNGKTIRVTGSTYEMGQIATLIGDGRFNHSCFNTSQIIGLVDVAALVEPEQFQPKEKQTLSKLAESQRPR